MLIDFINSKETDLVDDIRSNTNTLPDVTRLLGNESLDGQQRNLQQQLR